MKTPCEIIVWNIVPIIRKEFAIKLIQDHGLTQRNAAKKLGITEAAISRYVSGKRGAIEITNKKVLNEITKSVEIINKNNGKTTLDEICRICKILQDYEFIEEISNGCNDKNKKISF